MIHRLFSAFRTASLRHVAVCVAVISLAATPIFSENHETAEKPVLYVWTEGTGFYQHVEINGVPIDRDGFFSDTTEESVKQSAYFLFLTNGKDVVPDAELREKFDIKDDDIDSVVSKGRNVRKLRRIVHNREAPLEDVEFIQTIILFDLAQMEIHYRRDCFRDIIYYRLVNDEVGPDFKELIEQCKRA